MHLSNRQSKIISELLSNNQCITGQYLANITGITSRTIRGDVREINNQYNQEELLIQSISGKGYYIPVDKREDAIELIRKEQDYIMPILPNARVEHIIKHLIINPKGISLDTILEQLYISKSTLDRDIGKANERLQKFNLSLARKHNDYICIEGEEALVQEMCRIFFAKVVRVHSLDKGLGNEDIRRIFDRIKQVLVEALEISNTSLSGYEFDAAVIFLMVVVLRNKNGFTVKDYDNKNSSESKFTSTIIDMLNSQIDLDDSEKNYIKYYIDKLVKANKPTKNNNDLEAVLDSCITDISSTFGYEFTSELLTKLLSILCNIHYAKVNKLALSEIKKEYPLAAEMAVSLVNFVNHKRDLEIHDEILVKIVLAFACEMEQDTLKKEQKKRNIVVVCQSGEITNNLIKVKLKRFFPKFNVLGFYPLYKIQQALELKPEIIISTTMIDSENIPVVVISPLLKDYDVIKIDTVIRQLEHRESNSYEFNNLFKEDLFLKDMEAFNKHDVIKKLFDIIKQNEYANDGFFQAVIERENIASTAIGNMVAVPHAIGNSMGENVVAIGILKKPIDWNEENVQIVFLINIQNAADGTVQQIFKSFFEVISSQGKVERLIKSKNYYEFIKTINQ